MRSPASPVLAYDAPRPPAAGPAPTPRRTGRSDWAFWVCLSLIGGLYVLLILAMLVADAQFTTPGHLLQALQSREIRYATKLSLIACTVTTILSLWVAVPLGYLMSRWDDRPIRGFLDRAVAPVADRFPPAGWAARMLNPKVLLDAVLDIPIVLPPLVIGLSLLILMQTAPGRFVERLTTERMGWLLTYVVIPAAAGLVALLLVRAARPRGASSGAWALVAAGVGLATAAGAGLLLGRVLFDGQAESWLQRRLGTPITYAVPSVILAQFAVACAFAVRTMRVTFDQITPRGEHVALTLGCTRSQAFWLVAVPQSGRGMLTAATLAWARSLGEFGPILIFSGATRMRTEVLPTTVFLELSVGNIEAAVAVSLLMVIVAVLVLIVMRLAGSGRAMGGAVGTG